MSRCFPFPPPGYEKKIRTEEADLLTKEKHKEKKHKKDKKDKEKKEGKGKKDKERSKDKHKERKEKKEKHKDSKDKDGDKEKNRALEEKKIEVLPDIRDTEKLVTNTLKNNRNGDSRFVEELARRIRDGEAATGSQSEQKSKIPDQIYAGLTGKVVENNNFYPVQGTNHRRDNDKRIHPQTNFPVARSAENAVPRVSFGSNQKIAEGMGKAVDRKDQEKQMESLEKNQPKENVIKSDKPRDKEGLKKSEPKDKDRNKEKKREKTEVISKVGKEKPKFIEGGPRLKERTKDALDTRNSKPPDLSRVSNKNLTGEGNLGKRKDLERNGFLYENGSNRPNKLQRPVVSPISSALENGRRLGTTRSELQSVETKAPPKPESELKSGEARTPPKAVSELKCVENKTKTFPKPESELKSGEAKTPPKAVTELKFVENKTKTPPKPVSELKCVENKTPQKSVSELKCVETKTPQKSASELQGTRCKPNVKEHRVNGFIGSQEPKVVLPNSLAVTGTVKVKENGEASVKLPHPDLKYLDQILSIPEREELPQFDDQEWLFGDSTVKLKKPRIDFSVSDETRQVWDQAFRIESTDSVALPYVIPF